MHLGMPELANTATLPAVAKENCKEPNDDDDGASQYGCEEHCVICSYILSNHCNDGVCIFHNLGEGEKEREHDFVCHNSIVSSLSYFCNTETFF